MRRNRFGASFLILAALSAALALAPVGQAQDAEVSAASAAGKGPKNPAGKGKNRNANSIKLVFLGGRSAEPTTDAAKALARKLAESSAQGVTQQSLAKAKSGKAQQGMVSKTSRFVASDAAADGKSPTAGSVVMPGGRLYMAIYPTKTGLFGLVEWARSAGKTSGDASQAKQASQLGFRTLGVVEVYQGVLWNVREPGGVSATLAKKPDLVTGPLEPAVVSQLVLPKAIEGVKVGLAPGKKPSAASQAWMIPISNSGAGIIPSRGPAVGIGPVTSPSIPNGVQVRTVNTVSEAQARAANSWLPASAQYRGAVVLSGEGSAGGQTIELNIGNTPVTFTLPEGISLPFPVVVTVLDDTDGVACKTTAVTTYENSQAACGREHDDGSDSKRSCLAQATIAYASALNVCDGTSHSAAYPSRRAPPTGSSAPRSSTLAPRSSRRAGPVERVAAAGPHSGGVLPKSS